MSPARIEELIAKLKNEKIEFVVVGGIAARTYLSSYATDDLDICYSREPQNLERLANFLKATHARLRDVPAGLPFNKADARTLKSGLNFTFETDYGKLDLLGEVAGVGLFEQALVGAERVVFNGEEVSILSLPCLINAKKATGRPKDIALLAELNVILTAKSQTKKKG